MEQHSAHTLSLSTAAPRAQQPGAAPARELDSRNLLAGKACIAIRHGGDTYWLRSTRQGKLLLTK